MKKKLLFLLLVMLFPIMASAENISVSSLDEVKANNIQGNHLEFTGSTLTLTENINLVAFLDIKANTTLNLNGHDFRLSGGHVEGNQYQYGVTVFGNNTLTINGAGTVTIDDVYGMQTAGSGSPKIVINGGTFTQTGDFYMLAVYAGEIVINDGTFVTPYCVVNNFAGVYNLDGKITINGGTFTTDEDYGAPVMNSGTAVIAGGTFTSSGDEGNAVYTDPTGTTTITRGTFTTTGSDSVTIYNEGTTVVENGTFESSNGSAIENDTSGNANASLTLVGGSYSDSVNSVAPFVDNDSTQYTNTAGDAVVVPREVLVLKTFSVVSNVTEEELALINEAMSDGFQLGKTFDVTAWLVNPNDNNAKVEQVTETTEEVEVKLDVSDLPAVEEGLTREFEVVKIHNGVADAVQADDNGDGTISADSSEFSTYAVTYRDIDNTQNREDDDEMNLTTGTNPKTADTLILLILMMIGGLTGIVVTAKKLANN